MKKIITISALIGLTILTIYLAVEMIIEVLTDISIWYFVR